MQLNLACRPVHLARGLFLLCAACATVAAQKPSSPPKVGIDDQGNVWVASEDGRPLIMATQDHCLEAIEAENHQSMGCLVSGGVTEDGGVASLRQIEIYRIGGHKLVLDLGGAIREWRFWNNGKQVAVSFQTPSGETEHALYDAQSGSLVERAQEPADPAQLPQWAKGRAQIDDESVPTGPSSDEEHGKWIAKVMREIETIKPGMHRQDLDTLFHADGGLTSFGGSERYVLNQCSMIKIDVHFKRSEKKDPSQWNDPNDVIESVSKPYLQYPFFD